MVKSTYGTECFLMVNPGAEPVRSQHKMLLTIAYRVDDKTHYAMEGSIFIAGAAMQWIRDELELIEDAAQSSDIAASLDNNCGVYMVPALTGLGAPHWLPNARGAIFGMTSDSGKDQIVRAALESVACQSADLPSAMESDGSVTSQLRVDGGMASNDWFCQFLSDVLNLRVIRPSNIETTAVGAAYLARLHSGIIFSLDAVSNSWNPDRSFEPAMAPDDRDYLMRRWRKAVELVCEFADT